MVFLVRMRVIRVSLCATDEFLVAGPDGPRAVADVEPGTPYPVDRAVRSLQSGQRQDECRAATKRTFRGQFTTHPAREITADR